MIDKFIMAGSTALHICDSEGGEGIDKTIVLIHGYLESMLIFDDFVPLLYKRARIITLDLPGHGISVVEGDTHTMDFLADTVASALEALEIERATIVGHSMGGYVTLAFADRHPSMCEAIVLLSSTPNADSPEKRAKREREIELVSAGKKEMLSKVAPSAGFAAHNKSRMRDYIADLTEQVLITEDEGVLAILRGMMLRRDQHEMLHNLPARQLFIFGMFDDYIPVEVAKSVEERHPQAKVLWLEDSGHMGFLEQPELTAEAILEVAGV